MEVVITVLDDVTKYKKKVKASRPGFYKFMGRWA